jgi:Cof subfamily protein (haloacid dehalogenase superfamily)
VTDLRLVAVDLDGTLLNDHKNVSERNLSALEALLAQGVILVLASARDCASISQVVPIIQPGLYYIASGGALIYDPYTGEKIWADYLGPELVQECVVFLKQFNHPVFLNHENDYWVDRYNEHVELIEKRYLLQTKLFSEASEVEKRVMRVSLAAPVEILRNAKALAEKNFGTRVTVSLASPDWLDLLLPGAGKGALLKILQTRLGIVAGQTMAMGDYESDLSLFECASFRIAMGNAVDAVKESATDLTPTNNQDGVAWAIQKYFSHVDQEGKVQ